MHEDPRCRCRSHGASAVTATDDVVEEQEVSRAEPAHLAIGCLLFELARAHKAELAVRSRMEVSEPALGHAEEDDSGGGESIGDWDRRSGRREWSGLEIHLNVLEVRLSVGAVVDANVALRWRYRAVPAHSPTIPAPLTEAVHLYSARSAHGHFETSS